MSSDKGNNGVGRAFLSHIPRIRRKVLAKVVKGLPAHVEADDVIQEALLGVWQEIVNERLDTENGNILANKGVWSAYDHLRKEAPIPRSVLNAIRTYEYTKSKLSRHYDRPATREEILEELGWDGKKLDGLMLKVSTKLISTSNPLREGEEDGVILEDLLTDDSLSIADQYIHEERMRLVGEYMKDLEEFDGHCVRLYYFEDRTEKDIGNILGVTESRISQRLSRAKRDLRRIFRNHGIEY
jgi:RNA polymerase sigma factor FliA